MNLKVTNKISLEAYRKLRKYLLETKLSDEQILISLSKSLYEVVVCDNNEPIAMGRLLGDGFYYYMVTEVVVHPNYQGQKIGTLVISELIKYIRENSTDETYVYLMSAKNKEDFYKKFGFVSRPNEQFGPGMILKIKGE